MNIEKAMQMAFWMDRFNNPEFVLRVSDSDIEQFEKSIEYLGVKPKISISRHKEKPLTIIQMVDEQGNFFKPIESTEEGVEQRDLAAERHKQRGKARSLIDELRSFIATGDFAESTIRDTIKALEVLSR